MEASRKAAEQPADEDVIDLTDIIEKSDARRSPKESEADVGGQMSDLFNSGKSEDASTALGDMDSDIDELLSQMDSEAPAAKPAETKAAQARRPVNPDEKLEMPGMAEVDSLLEDLDIPQQPGSRSAGVADASAEPAVEDLDALLSDILDNPVPSAAQAGVSDKPGAPSPSGEIFDPEDNAAIQADLDAIFKGGDAGESSAPEGLSPEAEGGPDPVPSGDVLADLDALLENGDVPAFPESPSAADIKDSIPHVAESAVPAPPSPAGAGDEPPAEEKTAAVPNPFGETAMSAVGLEALLREGGPLREALVQVVRASVAAELHACRPNSASFPVAAGEGQNTAERLAELEARMNNLSTRLDAMETRINTVEDASARAIEQAAAAAAAKVIREEIMALLAER